MRFVPRLSAFGRKLRSAMRLNLSLLALVLLAWLLIGAADVLIWLIPYRRLMPLFGRPSPMPFIAPHLSDRLVNRARRIRNVIDIAARNAPFRADCYPQALTAMALCRVFRCPADLFFGARPTDDAANPIAGHAWVVSGSVTVCGGADSFVRYPILAHHAIP